jgi:hypothetical protein
MGTNRDGFNLGIPASTSAAGRDGLHNRRFQTTRPARYPMIAPLADEACAAANWFGWRPP